MNTIAIEMMNVGELYTLDEMQMATLNYKLVWKTLDNVFAVISDGRHFDVVCYVDIVDKMFEHVYSSDDHDYPITRVIYTLQKYGKEIADAHLAEDDGWFNGAYVMRENIEDVLQIVGNANIKYNRFNYAVNMPALLDKVSVDIPVRAPWVRYQHVEYDRFYEVLPSSREVVVVYRTMSVDRSFKASHIRGNTCDIYEHDMKVTEVRVLMNGEHEGFGRRFAPVPCRKQNLLLQWVRTICDAEGNVVEVINM